MAGHQISPAVKLRAEDAHGNKVARFTGNVTVALGNNPGGATLSGTTTVVAVDGDATFYDLSLDKTGTGYTLAASVSGGALVATSAAFDVAPGAATQLEFTVEPTTTTAGTALAPALQVRALDAAENLVPTFTGNVTVAFGGTSGEGSTLGGTRSEEHTSELQSRLHLVCRLLLEKKKYTTLVRDPRRLFPTVTRLFLTASGMPTIVHVSRVAIIGLLCRIYQSCSLTVTCCDVDVLRKTLQHIL